MADVLEEIVQKTRARLDIQKQNLPLAELRRQASQRKKIFPFAQALRKPDGIAVIAELKQASPSAGVIRQETDLGGRVKGYAKGGAAALSILTEEYYFHGSPYILELARKECDLPILRKDFIVDPYQIEESRRMGADAVLLITTLLPGELLKDLLAHAREAGMDALVETHDVADVEKALQAGATLIGINHRNLRTLQMDLSTAERLLPMIPKDGKTVVVESGIKTPEEAARFHRLGAHAVLIGETLMRHPKPEEIVRSFAQAGRPVKRKSV
jgi:indole-3-glycerol phosphate synthase